MKKIYVAILLIMTAVLIPACKPAESKVSESVFAMDTYMQLDVYGKQESLDKLKSEIERLDDLLSSTNEKSDIYRVNQSGTAEASEDTASLVKRSLELCKQTNGSLDITVYPIVEKWGFISQNYTIPSKSELNALLKNVGYDRVKSDGKKITVPSGCKLDLGAVAKGYAADRAKEILNDEGVDSALLNLGGTVLAYGKKPNGENWKVGVTDPENTDEYMGVIECADKIVATSGNYERYFEQGGKRYCHIIDPKTGYPVDNGIASVTVISNDGTKNDALSTALFVMGVDKAKEFIKADGSFDCVILTNDKKAFVTEGLKNGFSLKNREYEIIIV